MHFLSIIFIERPLIFMEFGGRGVNLRTEFCPKKNIKDRVKSFVRIVCIQIKRKDRVVSEQIFSPKTSSSPNPHKNQMVAALQACLQEMSMHIFNDNYMQPRHKLSA